VSVTECHSLGTIAVMKAAEKIAWLCRERGLTQKRVGELATLPENRISKWLDGQGEPTARQALRLSRVLEIPLDWLIDDEQDVPPPPPDLSIPEQRAVEMVRALRLGKEEVIRRLSGEMAATTPALPDPSVEVGGHRSLRVRDRTDELHRRLANHTPKADES
jgi:transcriptional regulator with XRE-family HTH domain